MDVTRPIPYGNLGMQFEGSDRRQSIYWCMDKANANLHYVEETVHRPSGVVIPNKKVIVCQESDTVTGVVSNRYRANQPQTKADFIHCFAGTRMEIVNIGTSRDYTKQWVTIKLDPREIAGDTVDQYMVIIDSFDGSGSFKIALTPIRVVCNNAFSIALRHAKRIWSIRHTGNLQWKMDEARRALHLSEDYILELDEFAHSMTQVRVDDKALKAILNQCFKAGPKATERELRTIEDKKDQFMVCYFMPDIDKFRGTGWGVINAMADYVSHAEPARHTASFDERRWLSLVDGDSLMNKAVTAVREI